MIKIIPILIGVLTSPYVVSMIVDPPPAQSLRRRSARRHGSASRPQGKPPYSACSPATSIPACSSPPASPSFPRHRDHDGARRRYLRHLLHRRQEHIVEPGLNRTLTGDGLATTSLPSSAHPRTPPTARTPACSRSRSMTRASSASRRFAIILSFCPKFAASSPQCPPPPSAACP